MIKKGINRRQFLQTSGLATAGAAAAASGAVLVAPDGAWALELTSLSKHVGKTLLTMSRRIYPHDDQAEVVPDSKPSRKTRGLGRGRTCTRLPTFNAVAVGGFVRDPPYAQNDDASGSLAVMT